MRYNTLVTVFFGCLFLLLKLFLAENAFALLNLPVNQENYPVAVVVIDPGHGGSDTGSIGILPKNISKKQNKILEKNIVLQLSKKVDRYLRDPKLIKRYKIRVRTMLTRKRDRKLSLEERTRFAKQYKCDLFVSVHMNSEESGTARGFETYFLNNTTPEMNSHLVKLNHKEKDDSNLSPDLRLLLRSITSDSMVNPSLHAAKILQTSVQKQLHSWKVPLESRGIRQSLLQVLLDAQAPAVLFEGPFLSNPEDLRLSLNPKVIDHLAHGIASGIFEYLKKQKL